MIVAQVFGEDKGVSAPPSHLPHQLLCFFVHAEGLCDFLERFIVGPVVQAALLQIFHYLVREFDEIDGDSPGHGHFGIVTRMTDAVQQF